MCLWNRYCSNLQHNFPQCGSWGFHLIHLRQFPFSRWLFHLPVHPSGTPPLRPTTVLCRLTDGPATLISKAAVYKIWCIFSRHKDKHLKIVLISFISSLMLTKICISTLVACEKFTWEHYRSMCASNVVAKCGHWGLEMWLVQINRWLSYKR